MNAAAPILSLALLTAILRGQALQTLPPGYLTNDGKALNAFPWNNNSAKGDLVIDYHRPGAPICGFPAIDRVPDSTNSLTTKSNRIQSPSSGSQT